MPMPATILIAARNAAATIQRAVTSALDQGDYPIILIDDFSDDDTVSLARVVAGRRLEVVRPPKHQTLGLTRQIGLMAVETPYGVWLDADDELLPGRVERMVQALKSDGAELASDAVELFDGLTGSFREVLPVPEFLKGRNPLARLFERNYLPGPGVIGFKTKFAQRIGYDPSKHGAEDIDFLLRAISSGARFHLLDNIGYRLYAYPQSLSRQIENQKRMYRDLLRKHQYEDVRNLYHKAGHNERITTWGLVSMALFREDYATALSFIDQAEEAVKDPLEVLEPDGPCPAPEGWRVSFHRGTALLLMTRTREAVACLEDAEGIRPTAEAANNLGVACARAGNLTRARTLFARSLERFPQFLDAKLNLEDVNHFRITTHLIRTNPNRADYSAVHSVGSRNQVNGAD